MKTNQDQLPGQANRNRTQPLLLYACLLPIVAGLLWTGCKQDARVSAAPKPASAAAAASNPSGTYNLVTVDGNKLPYSTQHEGHSMTIRSGRFTINEDGTCASQIFLAGREAPIEVKASYTREGSTLTMKWAGAGTTTGTVQGDTFTMNNEGMVLAYQK